MNNIIPRKRHTGWSHGIAALSALIYMWCISLTDFRQTGLQFIGPLLTIFAVHTVAHLSTVGLRNNVYFQITQKTLHTTVLLLFGVILCVVLVPESAHGNGVERLFSRLAGMLICVFVIVMLLVMFAGILFLVFISLRSIYRLIKPQPDDDGNQSNLHEIASIALTFACLLAASVEGVGGAYAFNRASISSASQMINASDSRVWETLATTASPDFPLPSFLAVFPRPIEVLVDEGMTLGASRVVRFKGREGEGYLRLQVVEKSSEHAKFQVLSDTSPIADWVAHRILQYQVEAKGSETQLTVSLEYDRLLAPAWFFEPFIGKATSVAMNVLARDVKERAENGG